MKGREIEQILRESGFRFIRRSKHCNIWSDGVSRIGYSTATSRMENSAAHKLRSEIARAIAKRNELNPDYKPPPPEPVYERTFIHPPRDPKLTVKLGDLIQKPELPEEPEESAMKHAQPYQRTWSKYTDEDKDKIGLRIIDLFEDEYTHLEISEALNKEGFRNSEGNPFTVNTVTAWCHQLGLKRKKPEATKPPIPAHSSLPKPLPSPIHVAPNPPPAPHVPQMAAKLPTPAPAPALPATPCPGRHVPEHLIAILKDPAISDSKKVRMVLMYMEDV